MGGVETLRHWVTGTQITGYWAYSPAETPVTNVGIWLQTLTEEFPNVWLWSGLTSIEIWNPERPDCPPDLRTKSALYHPGARKIQLRTYELNGGQLAHECGHHVQVQLRINPDTDRLGQALWRAFVAMSGTGALSYADQVEHYAEAWRYLFYPDRARPPINLPAGLKELFRCMSAGR
jgi:hypothetical protein